jgi:hypothetical protein
MRKGPGNAYDKWNISVVICETDIPYGGNHKTFELMTSIRTDAGKYSPPSNQERHYIHNCIRIFDIKTTKMVNIILPVYSKLE